MPGSAFHPEVRPVAGPRWGVREWVLTGVASWIAATVLYMIVFGLRRMTAGSSFTYPWPQVRLILGTFVIAALLCPLVVLVLRKVRQLSPPPAARIATYFLLGIAYWTGWAVLMSIFFPPAEATWLEGVSGRLVMGALVLLTIHTLVVTVFEAHWNLDRARRAEANAVALQAELAATEAAELKARLNPGLVFASLDTASHLLDRDERAARRVLADMSELLRVSLGREGVQLIPLKDELHLLLRYVRIRFARTPSIPELEIRLPRAAEVWPVPPLFMMSLVDELLRDGEAGAGAPIRLTVSGEARSGMPDRGREVSERMRRASDAPLGIAEASPGISDAPLGIGEGLRLFLDVSGTAPSGTIPAAAGGGIADARARLRTACGAGSSVELLPVSPGAARVRIELPAPFHPPLLLHPTAHAY